MPVHINSHQLAQVIFDSASDPPTLFVYELQHPAASLHHHPLSPLAQKLQVPSRTKFPKPETLVMVEYRAPHYQFPQRPLGPAFYPSPSTKSLTINPHLAPAPNPYDPQSASSQGSYNTHARRRTSSSGALPADSYPANYNPGYSNVANNGNNFQTVTYLSHRSGSNSTTSSNSSSSGRMDQTVPITLRRSGSNHTASSIATTSSNAYVTYLRRQKATVWCEKSQYEDPRLVAAQRIAKLRAAMEVVGSSTGTYLSAGYNQHGLGSGSGSTASSLNAGRSGKLGRSTNHVASTVKKAWGGSTEPGIANGALPSGIPSRLSATEVLGDEDEDETFIVGPGLNKRSGSGKSSLNSNHRKTNRSSSIRSDTNRTSSIYGNNVGRPHRNSSGSTPSYSPTSSIAESQEGNKPKNSGSHSPPGRSEYRNTYDHSYHNAGIPRRDNTVRRRGSLNEEDVVRTMTMSGVRLFVANPDV